MIRLMLFLRHRAALFCLLLAAFASTMVWAAPLQATVENQTRPTTCAEEDNVSMDLHGDGIRRFRVEALPPVYLASIAKDRTAPDFSGCNFDGGTHPTDPRYTFTPRREVLHDGKRWLIVGMVLPSFWRPNQVPVTLDGRTVTGFHLLQIFAKKPGRKPLEALVLYPADGYWRLKPLPAPRFGDGVYGSSFVLGPVEQDGRPVVNIASIAIDSKPLRIRLAFAQGGSAIAKVTEISQARTALDVTLTQPTHGDQRFAVLRSMYVAADNADMSEVRWQATPRSALKATPLPEVSTLRTVQVRFGRSIVSRHNTSAPDIRFSRFDGY
ncbi:hypothetical protein SRS16CHR_03179 [Variovorax sp. SRS16]|nr:hypothetical protein SRS16CHR_03179 [Variovorax sp. SRS16]